MRRVAQVAAVGVVCALLALLVWNVVHTSGGGVANKVNKEQIVAAPGWERPRVDTDGKMTLESLRGKVAVINFWQSYCAPCTEEAPTLAQSAKNWRNRGVVFVGIDVQDLRNPALAFIKRFKIDYPIVSDSGPLVGRYGVTGYPETFFINRHGCVVPPHYVGPVTHADLNRGIQAAIAEKNTRCGTTDT